MVDSHLKTTHGEGNMENKLRETAFKKDICEIGSVDQLTEDVLKVPVHLLKEEIVQGKVLHHAEEHLLGEADHNEKTSGLAIQFIRGNGHTKDNMEAFVHDPLEKHNGYSPKGLIDSAVINDRKNTKDDKLPEDALKPMKYVPVDETLEDLVEYADDEGQEAETITVKLTLQHKENIPALGDNLKVLNVLSDSDELVEYVEDDAEGEVHGEGTDDIVLEKVHKISKHTSQ